MLERPVPGTGVDPRYRMLRAALDAGWRIGDHITNLAERVIFMASGEMKELNL